MNIVKGVADLIRRTSSGQAAETAASGSQPQRFSPPGPKIRFRYLMSTSIVGLITLIDFGIVVVILAFYGPEEVECLAI